MSQQIALAVVEMALMMGVGYAARRLDYLGPHDLERWSKVVLDWLFPPLIFATIVGGLEPGQVGRLWALPLLGLGIMVCGAACGWLALLPLRRQPQVVRRTAHHLCTVNNYTFLPLVILSNLGGDGAATAIANLFVLNIGSILGFFTLGVALLGDGGSWREDLKKLFSPPLVAIGVALAVTMAGLGPAIPDTLMVTCEKIGSASTPCMLIVIGASMHPLPAPRYPATLAYVSALRLIVIPAVLVLLIGLLPLPEEVRLICYVEAFMPVAATSAIITRTHGGDSDLAVQALVATTLGCLVTIPLGMSLVLG